MPPVNPRAGAGRARRRADAARSWRERRRWARLAEYTAGALWVLPSISALVALAVGSLLASIEVDRDGPLGGLVFQGTADDARSLLAIIATTMVAVIATVLGLAVVALQLSSTQYSPRLVRNFLRDGVTQRVLSIFLATFAYSAAGLYTVGVASGARVESFPRLAVSGALLLLFASLAAVIVFADHLTHSLQIDTIMGRAARNTMRTVDARREADDETVPPRPTWAHSLTATRSGYVQAVGPGSLLRLTSRTDIVVDLEHRVGDYVVAGTPIAWMWGPTADAPLPDLSDATSVVADAVEVGFERTLRQDFGFGIRQLVDSAIKALSPAVNDPYTAVQAIHHLADIFVVLAPCRLGTQVIHDRQGRGAVVLPGRRFGDFLASACGQIRRYGAQEPTVVVALLELLSACCTVGVLTDGRLESLATEGALVLADAERLIRQPADLRTVHRAYSELERDLERLR